MQPLSGHTESIILLKPTATWSVTGKDDVQQLKRLASGVGWEFEPNAATTAGLRKIGIKSVRCINVDPLPGSFSPEGKFVVGKPDRLLAHLATCRWRTPCAKRSPCGSAKPISSSAPMPST